MTDDTFKGEFVQVHPNYPDQCEIHSNVGQMELQRKKQNSVIDTSLVNKSANGLTLC
jgi:hypothetical protein